MKILAVINPKSGGGLGQKVTAELKKLILSGKLSSESSIFDINDAANWTKNCRDVDLIILGGGDGTIASLMSQLPEDAAKVAILPLGTGNDLARELGHFKAYYKKGLAEFITAAQSSPSQSLQLWRADWGDKFEHSKVFANYFSLGFDARVVSDFANWRSKSNAPRLISKFLNRLAYPTFGLINLGDRLSKFILSTSVDSASASEIPNATSLIFANIQSYMGGAFSNRFSDPFDEVCEAVLVPGFLSYFKMALSALPFKSAKMLGQKSYWQLDLSCPSYAQIDGEHIDQMVSKVRILPANSVLVAKL